MIARLGSALRRTLGIACERPRATLWTLVAATCALFAIAVSALALSRVDRSADEPRGAASMVVYLGDGMDDAHANALEHELAAIPGVMHAELVAPAESARRLQQALANDPALLDGVDVASLPASIELQLAPGMRDVIAMSPTLSSLRGAPGIEDVVVEDEVADRRADELGSLRVVGWTAAALVAGLSLVVFFATLRVRLERGKQEVRVHALLGASPSFTIVPTALAGALHGIVAAVAAAVALAIALAMWGGDLSRALHGAWQLTGPSLAEIALLVGIGGMLGMLAGGLAGASRARA